MHFILDMQVLILPLMKLGVRMSWLLGQPFFLLSMEVHCWKLISKYLEISITSLLVELDLRTETYIFWKIDIS